jgi:hypothetical protein
MSTTSASNESELLERVIREAIRNEIANRLEKEVKFARDHIENQLQEIVAKVSIAVFTQIKLERFGKDLVIRVEMPK